MSGEGNFLDLSPRYNYYFLALMEEQRKGLEAAISPSVCDLFPVTAMGFLLLVCLYLISGFYPLPLFSKVQYQLECQGMVTSLWECFWFSK